MNETSWSHVFNEFDNLELTRLLVEPDQVLPHPPYSLNLAPSDFHIFNSLQHILAGQSFKTHNDVKKCMNEYFYSKDEPFSIRVFKCCLKDGKKPFFCIKNTSSIECLILIYNLFMNFIKKGKKLASTS